MNNDFDFKKEFKRLQDFIFDNKYIDTIFTACHLNQAYVIDKNTKILFSDFVGIISCDRSITLQKGDFSFCVFTRTEEPILKKDSLKIISDDAVVKFVYYYLLEIEHKIKEYLSKQQKERNDKKEKALLEIRQDLLKKGFLVV